MAFGDSDLPIFLADMGEPATWNGITVTGIVDVRDDLEPMADGSMQAAVASTSFTIKTSDWPGIDDGATITLRGGSFVVYGTPLRLSDGAFKRLSLAEVTA